MGAVKVMLSEKSLRDRERHNSRLFVDLCENIHIHYREYRFVFSLPEYFEFIDIVSKSTIDVKNYLLSNPNYAEEKYKTTLMVAGGKERQMKFLENSPQPNCSKYFNNSLRIELQEEYITDEIHIHYRDFRLALNRQNFKDIAESFTEANQKLTEFESKNPYVREDHEDRGIGSWVQSEDISKTDTNVLGIKAIPIEKIISHWHEDIVNDWTPEPKLLEAIKKAFKNNETIAPVVVLETGSKYKIVDGHHRVRSAIDLGISEINSVILRDMTWEDTEPLRKAEVLLKQFDKDTSYRYGVSSFFKDYLANTLNTYYQNHFFDLTKKPNPFYSLLKNIKKGILTLPLPQPVRQLIFNFSGSKKYWR